MEVHSGYQRSASSPHLSLSSVGFWGRGLSLPSALPQHRQDGWWAERVAGISPALTACSWSSDWTSGCHSDSATSASGRSRAWSGGSLAWLSRSCQLAWVAFHSRSAESSIFPCPLISPIFSRAVAIWSLAPSQQWASAVGAPKGLPVIAAAPFRSAPLA